MPNSLQPANGKTIRPDENQQGVTGREDGALGQNVNGLSLASPKCRFV